MFKKLTKADIDRVRHIEGFPIATDDDIIALSDAPFYTACPNPFIEEFIRENGTVYDEATDDYKCEPFAADVGEDKHDLIYNVHGYHTKVPPKAIQAYIEHYTKKGDIILDGFCGSGMAGVAAQLCKEQRAAIVSDLSTYATFISANYTNPNSDTIIQELENIISEIEREFGEYYQTRHNQMISGTINYVVWSCVYFCPVCAHEFVYYDLMDKYKMKSTQTVFKCEKCNAELERSRLAQKRKTEFDGDLGVHTDTLAMVPVLINYSVGKTRFSKKPDEQDIEKLTRIRTEKKGFFPKTEIYDGDKTDHFIKKGYKHTKQLYFDRTLFFLSKFWDKCREDNRKLFLLTGALAKLTILNRYMPEHGSRALVGPLAGTFYIPPLCVENDVIGQLRFQLRKLQNLRYEKGKALVSTQSATDMRNIPNNSIDYIFVDPPFGANIMYSELNILAESWLGVFTEAKDEAIMNNTQKKSLVDYQALMASCFKELYRVLKPGRWITIEFHNSQNRVWNAIQEALSVAGFIVADVRILNKEKKTINQFNARGAVDQDLIITAYKPKESFKREFIAHAGQPETAWSFVRQHLENLPVAVIKNNKIELIAERQAFLLFDRMVAYHIMNGISVPLDSSDFYKGLDERFIKRDGMYFLADQVNEYDTVRITKEVESIQFELFVTNERSAIAWLYQQLTKPQTYGELQPQFMQQLKAVDKYEAMPELAVLLDDNFIQDDNGRWYIPDRTKEGDVQKLREKKLYKEFEGYIVSKGKLKLFRLEAVRLGFARLWADKNYKLIVQTAERLPENVIQEDDKLLMYYDISLSRMG